jgi:hypothetical protein
MGHYQIAWKPCQKKVSDIVGREEYDNNRQNYRLLKVVKKGLLCGNAGGDDLPLLNQVEFAG